MENQNKNSPVTPWEHVDYNTQLKYVDRVEAAISSGVIVDPLIDVNKRTD